MGLRFMTDQVSIWLGLPAGVGRGACAEILSMRIR